MDIEQVALSDPATGPLCGSIETAKKCRWLLAFGRIGSIESPDTGYK
jgi:hypothetical protein